MASRSTIWTGRDIQFERIRYEVIFKSHHVTHYPWEKNDEVVMHLPGFSEVPFQNVKVEVTRLCHVTHNSEAELINQHDAFVFKPKKKLGKPSSTNRKTLVICDPTDRAPDGGTKYRQISESEQVLPGCYVWWSIDNSCFPSKGSCDPYTFRPPYSYGVASDFTVPYQSNFGNKKFLFNLSELLQCYQETHRDRRFSSLPKIGLRCGGTQRYNTQICKVIIVCPEYCPELSVLEYPPIDTLSLGMLLHYERDGKVQAYGTLTLTIQNGVTIANYGLSEHYSWDTYAFAFYYPSEEYILKCPKVNCQFPFVIEVDHGMCIRKERPPGRSDLMCPNEIARRRYY